MTRVTQVSIPKPRQTRHEALKEARGIKKKKKEASNLSVIRLGLPQFGKLGNAHLVLTWKLFITQEIKTSINEIEGFT